MKRLLAPTSLSAARGLLSRLKRDPTATLQIAVHSQKHANATRTWLYGASNSLEVQIQTHVDFSPVGEYTLVVGTKKENQTREDTAGRTILKQLKAAPSGELRIVANYREHARQLQAQVTRAAPELRMWIRTRTTVSGFTTVLTISLRADHTILASQSEI